VQDHLQRAVSFTHGDLGAHGLLRLDFADWNDTINLATGAESLLTACLYGKALLELATLADFMGQAELAGQMRTWHAEMAERVNQAGWDGEWYLSYFAADGQPPVSHRNAAGQIYNFGQSWPIIAGFADPERAHQGAGGGLPAAEHALRDKAERARLQWLRSDPRRHHHLPARRQGKRRDFPAHQPVDGGGRNADGERRAGLCLLSPGQPGC